MERIKEKMIIRNGKLTYAVKLETGKDDESRNPYLYISNGDVTFSDSIYSSSTSEFDFNDGTHLIAKQMFVEQLRTSIRSKIYDLKILESVLTELGLRELIENFEDDVKMLSEFTSSADSVSIAVKERDA